ncbi:hypothetical protein RDMS_09330 [Deinococcus sp. RL]|uniref:hypothetical protein n=1 Tax=Deinococcus sp. RL TaxID=1489678 RepID=UPI0004DAABBE|nr:hypothetical protein [Deinococcus sp. RL]KEF34052.1 hypothetical protein RDMS_09330 [Deinococcus sp. RL]
MTTALVLVFLSLAGAGVLLLTRRRGPGLPGEPRRFRPPPRRMVKTGEDVWLRRLMTVTRGDRGAIERAVTAKRRKFPRAPRAELLEMVYDEYRRDHARD